MVTHVSFEKPFEKGVGPGRTLFDRNEFTKWEDTTGRTVTMDVNAGIRHDTSCLDDPHASSLSDGMQGHHVWMDPRPSKLHALLTLYAEQKAKAPSTTSLCVLVPRWVGGSGWRKLLGGMQLLKEYPANTALYFDEDSKLPLPGEQHPRQLWYDPCIKDGDPKPQGNSAWCIEDDGPRERYPLTLKAYAIPNLAMKYNALLGGRSASVLMDTGASGSFVTTAMAKKSRAPITKDKHKAVQGAGGRVKIRGQCQPRLELQDITNEGLQTKHRSSPVLHLLKTLPGGFDIILGQDWLEGHHATLDCHDKTCLIQQARPPVTLHASQHDGSAGTDSSGVQLKEPGSATSAGTVVESIPRPVQMPVTKKPVKAKTKAKAQVKRKAARKAAKHLPLITGPTPRVTQAMTRKRKAAPQPVLPREARPQIWAIDDAMDLDRPEFLLSALQFKRCAKKAKRIFAILLSEFIVDTEPDKNAHSKEDPHKDIPVDIRAVIDKYADVFEEIPAGLPPDRGVSHTIPLIPGAKAPYKRMYRLSPRERDEVEKQIKELLAKGWIEPSQSPFGAPIVFAPKKDGSIRMCVDYRALNLLTVKNRYPLPRIDDLLDRLHGATIFTSMDLQTGFNQILITQEDVEKTAFLTHRGLYQYRVLCFGISNAPSTFQSVMNRVLARVIGKTCMVYMDDILVYSKNKEDHADHLAEVLELLREAKLYAKLSKCTFAQPETRFLGHVISDKGIAVDPKKIEIIMNWPTPKNVGHVRSFLGLATFFRRFCKHFSTIAHDLHALLHKDKPWEWGQSQETTFKALKILLSTAPILVPPNLEPDAPPFHVTCDASQVGLGALLSQDGHPVAYESRKMLPAETRYGTGEQELLAVVHAMRTWRCYLEGVKSVVVTDHNPNTYLQTQPMLSRRQVRWSEYLQNFDFTWMYKPGVNNPADPLSRMPGYETEELKQVPNFELHCLLYAMWSWGDREEDYEPWEQQYQIPSMETLLVLTREQRRQRREEKFGVQEVPAPPAASKKPEKGPYVTIDPDVDLDVAPPRPPASIASFQEKCRKGYTQDPWFKDPSNKQDLEEEDGLYFKSQRLVVPDVGRLRAEIMIEEHDTPYGGHQGRDRTVERIGRMFWWPSINKDIETFVKTCHACQQNKVSRRRAAGALQPLPIPLRRWSDVSMEFITALPITSAGNTQIVVFVDRMTKMVHLDALDANATAEDVALSFRHNVFRLHGLPLNIVSDRDSKFTSHFWAELMRLIGSKRNLSTAYHPRSDGQTERTNQVLEDMLRQWVNQSHDDWDTLLDCAEFAMNNSYNSTVKDTPFRLNYGCNPLTPLSIEANTRLPLVRNFVKDMTDSLRLAKHAMKSAQSRNEHYFNLKRRPQEFAVGDKVMLRTTNLKFKGTDHAARKLFPLYVGPFPVESRIGKLAYRITLPDSMEVHNVFHTELLKPYHAGDRMQPPPLTVTVDGYVEFRVQAVLAHRIHKTGKKPATLDFFVSWEGYDSIHNSWEPEANLGSAKIKLEIHKIGVGLPIHGQVV